MVMVFYHSSKAGESGEGQKLHVLPFIQQKGESLLDRLTLKRCAPVW